MGIDTSVIWAIIIYFAVFMYVLLDGFDLGIGMLFPFVKDKRDRDTMMNTVAPVWDGNETWLVLGGEGLLAAFPVAYSIILSGLYLPLIFMLVGLVFRGVAFEFRFKAKEHEAARWRPPSSRASRSAPSSTASRCRGAAMPGVCSTGSPRSRCWPASA
jgi:cytochrome d ubiquinol oxidase subunit II